jgi:hypothetical protein
MNSASTQAAGTNLTGWQAEIFLFFLEKQFPDDSFT